MSERLEFHPIGMALWTEHRDAETDDLLPGLATARVLRFRRPVRLDLLRVQPGAVRWAPDYSAAIAHVVVRVFDRDAGEWREVRDFGLPPRTDVAGPPHELPLEGLETDHLHVACDLEHPVPPSHGEQWANPHNVPYSALEHLECLGAELAPVQEEPPVERPLELQEFSPRAADGMAVEVQAGRWLVYRGPKLEIGFSLLRPMLTHLGWDGEGEARSGDNLIYVGAGKQSHGANLTSGPFARDLSWDLDSLQWGGKVSVCGNTVSYTELRILEGWVVNAEFEVWPDRLRLRLGQTLEDHTALVEGAAWRLCWNPRACATSTWAYPVRTEGRTGECRLPALFMAPGKGTLSVQAVGQHGERAPQPSGPLTMVESSRLGSWGTVALLPGAQRLPTGDLLLQRGRHEVELELRVGQLMPLGVDEGARRSGEDGVQERALRRYLASGLGFRPEYGGFSNNAYSVHCHVSQLYATDVACALQPPPVGPDPAELARETITLALQGGPGYGDNRELYQDSDPSLLISAAAIHRARPSAEWLRCMWPYISRAARRVLDDLDERGLLRCRRLSGNTGEKHWSSNAWDVISFGHYDAYSNAHAYRALRGLAVLARETADAELGGNAEIAAQRLRREYLPCFLNEETQLIAGWRSLDDQLHDYLFPWINGLAVCYGLVDLEQGRRIMERLEQYRRELGPHSFHLGMAANLVPVAYGDHAMPGNRADSRDAFGLYINGCITPCLHTWYFRALALVGLTEVAERACRELSEGFDQDFFMGGIGSATEFRTWEGLPTGYEGPLVGVPHALLAVVRHLYPHTVPDPEWWPA